MKKLHPDCQTCKKLEWCIENECLVNVNSGGCNDKRSLDFVNENRDVHNFRMAKHYIEKLTMQQKRQLLHNQQNRKVKR